MKKLAKILATLLCCCVVCISCETDNYKRDHSLTGSISYNYEAKVEGTYDGNLLADDVGIKYGNLKFCGIAKISKKKVSFYCNFIWGKQLFRMTIPDLPVYGKPYDVTFDHVSSKSKVQHNDVEYNNITASIKGWMKRATREMDITRSIVYPNYICGITINCIIDGKELILKITALRGV